MEPRPVAHGQIGRDDWPAALGRTDRVADWGAFFANALADAPWREVLARWIARLAPAICASATHGVIRVGHAVRSLGEAETTARIGELADGLGYWAAAYQTLPTGRDRPRCDALHLAGGMRALLGVREVAGARRRNRAAARVSGDPDRHGDCQWRRARDQVHGSVPPGTRAHSVARVPRRRAPRNRCAGRASRSWVMSVPPRWRGRRRRRGAPSSGRG